MPPKDVVNRITNALTAEGIYSPNTLAYALATIKRETGGTFQPVNEGFSPQVGRQQAIRNGYSGGANYYGRGYIQLTHDYNYRDIGKRIGVDLLHNPDLALNPDVAAKILAAFFKDRGVANAASKGDFVNARRPINGYDHANEIAANAKAYLPMAQTAKQVKPVQPKVQPQKSFNYAPGIVSPLPAQKKSSFNLIPQAYAEQKPAVQNYSPAPTYNSAANYTSTATHQPAYSPPRPAVNYSPVRQTYGPSLTSYTIRPGDTLSGIAQKYLGNANAYKSLGYSGDPRKLQIGTKLNIYK